MFVMYSKWSKSQGACWSASQRSKSLASRQFEMAIWNGSFHNDYWSGEEPCTQSFGQLRLCPTRIAPSSVGSSLFLSEQKQIMVSEQDKALWMFALFYHLASGWVTSPDAPKLWIQHFWTYFFQSILAYFPEDGLVVVEIATSGHYMKHCFSSIHLPNLKVHAYIFRLKLWAFLHQPALSNK